VRRVHDTCRQAALVEAFVGRRELNVSVIELDGRPTVLPLAEIDFAAFGPDRPRIVGYEAKWLAESFEFHHTPRIIPAPLPRAAAEAVRRAARAAWDAMGCRGYARVDFRLDDAGRPVVLEVNANPDISPGAGLAAAVDAAGIGYDRFIAAMLDAAVAAGPAPAAAAAQGPRRSSGAAADADATVRFTRPADRQAIMALIHATGFFNVLEVDVAREVLDDALLRGPRGHYQSYCMTVDRRPVGWVCFGPTPCTRGTFDIYWIAVHPQHQGRGVGRRLMAHAEKMIAARHGRLVVVETSGRAAYLPTRQFYARVGYDRAASVPDFYAPGDAKAIYVKRLAPPPVTRPATRK
jgi:ribosomal protein S18 acetylase RimI-like enzyme